MNQWESIAEWWLIANDDDFVPEFDAAIDDAKKKCEFSDAIGIQQIGGFTVIIRGVPAMLRIPSMLP